MAVDIDQSGVAVDIDQLALREDRTAGSQDTARAQSDHFHGLVVSFC